MPRCEYWWASQWIDPRLRWGKVHRETSFLFRVNLLTCDDLIFFECVYFHFAGLITLSTLCRLSWSQRNESNGTIQCTDGDLGTVLELINIREWMQMNAVNEIIHKSKLFRWLRSPFFHVNVVQPWEECVKILCVGCSMFEGFMYYPCRKSYFPLCTLEQRMETNKKENLIEKTKVQVQKMAQVQLFVLLMVKSVSELIDLFVCGWIQIDSGWTTTRINCHNQSVDWAESRL